MSKPTVAEATAWVVEEAEVLTAYADKRIRGPRKRTTPTEGLRHDDLCENLYRAVDEFRKATRRAKYAAAQDPFNPATSAASRAVTPAPSRRWSSAAASRASLKTLATPASAGRKEPDVRNMSFAMTIVAIRDQSKTVTRRFGWWFLKPGDLEQPVEKGMGLRKGEHVVPIGPPIRTVSTRGEPLNTITPEDVVREGFPDMTPEEFVAMLCRHYGCAPDRIVNRIVFEYTAPAGGEVSLLRPCYMPNADAIIADLKAKGQWWWLGEPE